MPRGGYRAGAGRPTTSELARIRALINDTLTDDGWKKIIGALAGAAQNGDARCAELLMRYAFGVPVQMVAGEPGGEPVKFVEVRIDRTGERRE